eukprot:TRINITY_DN97435_c0_g1_i1.p1 TRINITY_DN97435_c0_g1~~TRINITY_DN97435_c0_g1_i1.p1  ORF type:complete len:356 (-),score=32.18 TRINITY_DN97435_c0_g1_i1:59-1084(-)
MSLSCSSWECGLEARENTMGTLGEAEAEITAGLDDQVIIRHPKTTGCLDPSKVEVPAVTPGHLGLDLCCELRGTPVVRLDDIFGTNGVEESPQQQEMQIAAPARFVGLDPVQQEVHLHVESAEPKDTFWGYGNRMDDLQMLESLWWCTWCCCIGAGCHERRAPLSLTSNCLCFNSTCQTAPIMERTLCGFVHECIGCVYLCKTPPQQGVPRCICCSRDMCGICGGRPLDRDKKREIASSTKTSPMAAFTKHLSEPFVLWFMCCCGCRVTPPMDLVDTYCKCICCEYWFSTGCPSLEAGLCHFLLNCWCCYSMCKCPPPAHHNPVIACCGTRVGGKDLYQPR